MGRNRTPKTPRTQTREGETMLATTRTIYANNITPKQRTTASKTKKQQQHAVTTTTITTTTRKQPNKALSPTPIKPRSTQETAEKAQMQAPTSPQNPKRNPHKIGKLTINRKTTKTNNRRKQTMKTEAQIWEKINEPKVTGLITGFDKNGKPTYIFRILDKVPKITRKRR